MTRAKGTGYPVRTAYAAKVPYHIEREAHPLPRWRSSRNSERKAGTTSPVRGATPVACRVPASEVLP